MTVIVENDPGTAETLRAAVGPGTTMLANIADLRAHLDASPDLDTALIGPGIDLDDALRFAEVMRVNRPALGVVLVRGRLDTALLAEALRAGVREVVTDRDLPAVVDAVRRSSHVSRQLRAQTGGGPLGAADGSGTLVTVFAAKGGCGKTTLATNLAAALADKGQREVCIVDLDLAFGDVAIALQLFPAHTIADAVPLGDSLDAEAVTALLTAHSPGLTTLVAPVDPGTSETIPAALVGDVLRILKQQFEYVIVDTPPAFTDTVLAAFDETDVLALIATLDIPALKNLKLTFETLELLNYPREHWKLVLNRADSKVGLAPAEVEKTLRLPIAAQIPSSRSVPASINRGVPIVLDEPAHPVSVAIRLFAETHIATRASGAAAAGRVDRRSLLRRWSRTSS
jgi:pilus assembly protein CpaE